MGKIFGYRRNQIIRRAKKDKFVPDYTLETNKHLTKKLREKEGAYATTDVYFRNYPDKKNKKG